MRVYASKFFPETWQRLMLMEESCNAAKIWKYKSPMGKGYLYEKPTYTKQRLARQKQWKLDDIAKKKYFAEIILRGKG